MSNKERLFNRQPRWGEAAFQIAARYFLRALAAWVRWAPMSLNYWLADRLGAGLYRWPRFRQVALENLRRVFGPGLPDRTAEYLARRSVQNNCRVVVEFLKLPTLPPEEVARRVTLEGVERLDAALARGRGVILLTAHYGNWEWMGARLVQAGYSLHVIAREQDDADITALVRGTREGVGMRVLERREVREALRCLRGNGVLGVLADQYAGRRGTIVDFLGTPTSTVIGPAVFALRTGAAIVPAFISRNGNNHHRVQLQPAVPLVQTGNREADIVANTARFNRIIAAQIRERPEEWLWIHRRWKLRHPRDFQALQQSVESLSENRPPRHGHPAHGTIRRDVKSAFRRGSEGNRERVPRETERWAGGDLSCGF